MGDTGWPLCVPMCPNPPSRIRPITTHLAASIFSVHSLASPVICLQSVSTYLLPGARRAQAKLESDMRRLAEELARVEKRQAAQLGELRAEKLAAALVLFSLFSPGLGIH